VAETHEFTVSGGSGLGRNPPLSIDILALPVRDAQDSLDHLFDSRSRESHNET